MRTKEMPKLIRCPKCPDAEMGLMDGSVLLQKAEMLGGKPVLIVDEEYAPQVLVRIYLCGMCGYCEFYVPGVGGSHIIEAPTPQFRP